MANKWERGWYKVLVEKLGVCLLWVRIKKIVKSSEQQKWGEGEVECEGIKLNGHESRKERWSNFNF